jgi:hypothetical protein
MINNVFLLYCFIKFILPLFQGRGEFIVGATSSYAQIAGSAHVGQFVGAVSDMNIWTYLLSFKDIKLMGLGCGRQLVKPYVSWELFKDSFIGELTVRKSATCKDKKGKITKIYIN